MNFNADDLWSENKTHLDLGIDSIKKICSIHGEYESKMLIVAGMKIESKCPFCLEEELSIEKEKRKKDRYNFLFEKSGFGNNFKNILFKDFHCDKNEEIQKAFLKRSQDFVENFNHRKKDGKGFFFRGPVGTGKTYLAAIIANELMLRGRHVSYITSPELFRMRDFHATEELLKKLKNCDLLIIDELGQQQGAISNAINQNMREMTLFFEIINERHSNNKPFILISNIEEDEDFIQIFGTPIFDRIRDRCLFFQSFSKWDSYRGYETI